MAIFFSVLLGISLVGMIMLLALKRYELNTGTIFFAGARPAADNFFRRLSLLVEKILPALAREQLYRAATAARMMLQRGIAQIVLQLEHWLELVLDIVRQKTTIDYDPGDVSPFLREVADHKKQLIYRKHVRRTKIEKVEEPAKVE